MEWYTWIISIVFILALIKFYVVFTSAKCKSSVHLDGKTVLITGSNTGIGKQAALDIAGRGARVILACRNLEAANKARDEIVCKTGNNNVIVQKLDLLSLDSVRQFVKTIRETEERLDVLVNNAGCLGPHRQFTPDGLYALMQVNHFGPFLLTNLLVDMLIKSAPSRIVNTSSFGHCLSSMDEEDLNNPSIMNAVNYCNSKLCNVWMTKELARKLQGTSVTCNSLHPGWVRTDIIKSVILPVRIIMKLIGYIFFKNPVEGAQTLIYACVADEIKDETGKYFAECSEHQVSRRANDKELAAKIWNASGTYVKLESDEKHPLLWTNVQSN